MAAALVGSLGPVSQGVAGAAVTPAWGASENRVPGNLLICWVAVTQSATIPATPAGWSPGTGSSNLTTAVRILYKVATGADAAPTIPLVASGVIAAMLGEFSGMENLFTPTDTGGFSPGGATSPQVMAASFPDQKVGEIACYSFAARYSIASVPTFTPTLNNGQTSHAVHNSPTSTVNHYYFDWAIPTSNGVADQTSLAVTTTNLADTEGVIQTFRLPYSPNLFHQRLRASRPRMPVFDSASRCWKRRPSGISVPRLWTPEPVI